jgi:uncharacterized membrane protein YpjA
MSFKSFSEKIFGNSKILLFLISANLAGFCAGIYFYWEQLAASSPFLWIAIMDSPLSVLLFAGVCLLFYSKRKIPETLKLLASAYVIKYGIWTMLTLWLYQGNYAIFGDQVIGVLDFALHLGMVLEGLALVPLIKPKIKNLATVLLLLLANDYLDYFFGTVTRIPLAHINLLMLESFAATIAITFGIFIYQNKLS